MSDEETVEVEHDQNLIYAIEYLGLWYDVQPGTLELKMGNEIGWDQLPEVIFEVKKVTGGELSGGLSNITGLRSLTLTDPESDSTEEAENNEG